MKNTHWKAVMFLALTLMMLGAGVSLWGIQQHIQSIAVTGIVIIGTVCVSWWFWVMFIIRTMMTLNERTVSSLVGIQEDLGTVKILLKEYEQGR
jgi:quinol-cytochrome oxidoreductase complex cytochrome b subunit